jgi:hypothetical protein
MTKLPTQLALLALLAGTSLASTPVIVSAQSGTDTMDQSQSMDPSTDGGNAEELLLKNQNDANSGEQTQMPDAEQQDQAVTDDAQKPATENLDQATDEDLLKRKNQSEDQAQSPDQDSQTEDQATDENLRKQKTQTEDQAQSPSDEGNTDQAADRERRKDKNATEDTATDTRSKKQNSDETASDSDTKVDEDSDQAASKNTSNETTGSINISAEQKSVIKNTIIETNVKPVDVDFKVSIGVNVPKTIELHPLPPRVVEIVPAYREYVYFIVADGSIVIVDPDSYEVVYVIVV